MRFTLLILAVFMMCGWGNINGLKIPFEDFRELSPSETNLSGSEGDYIEPKEAAISSRFIKNDEGTQSQKANCVCGRRNTVTRIVGGQQTTVHEYPWQVALVSKYSNRPFCGGSIISDVWILSAGHCVNSNTKKNVRVVIGEHKWDSSSETSITSRRALSQVLRHKYYSSSTLNHDISLLRLADPIVFPSNNKIAPVCMPSADHLYESVNAIVTGWGTLYSGGYQPTTLQEVTVPTMSNSQCKATSYSSSSITDNMICAGLSQGGKDSCQGDSGGPMVTYRNGAYEQIGIVSWGYGCASANYPGVYTRVSVYVGILKQLMTGTNSCGQ
ncbi:trypsin-1-like isoform X1 [Scylla paramamosain]|uniref:trypsin-1-like isoform X1 n=1 Tax=Scylla paramamosain TaxID=85552 RepID=UPI0030833987